MLTLMTMNSGKTVACHGKLRKFLGLSQDEAKNLFDSIKDGNPYTVSGVSESRMNNPALCIDEAG